MNECSVIDEEEIDTTKLIDEEYGEENDINEGVENDISKLMLSLSINIHILLLSHNHIFII